MIHLACVVDDVQAAHDVCDDEGSGTIVVVLDRDLACVGRVCDRADPPTDPAHLVEHDQLVARLMQACSSVVPFRYGTVLPDTDAVRAELSVRRQGFYALLDRLRGRVELALRATPGGLVHAGSARSDDPGEGPGRSYLRSLRVDAAGYEPLERLHRTLAASAVAAVAEPVVRAGMKASYLLEEFDVDGFRRALDRAVDGAEGVGQVSLTGPWAPYTFAAVMDPTMRSGQGSLSGGEDG